MKRTDIQFLSPREPVHMADEWFGLISADHFWFKRRFEVFRKFAGSSLDPAEKLAEVGCGSGVLQRQIEEWLGRGVDGFDLNEGSLAENQSRRSRLFYYNIYDCREEFRARYDAVILFDVLEHVDDDLELLKTLRFYLNERGVIYVNVPALPALYSRYDEVAGHLRRYVSGTLAEKAQAAGFKMTRWTYWGFPLLPLLWARKRLLKFKDKKDVIEFGFSRRNPFLNQLLYFLACGERIPQQVSGTSLMALLVPAASR